MRNESAREREWDGREKLKKKKKNKSENKALNTWNEAKRISLSRTLNETNKKKEKFFFSPCRVSHLKEKRDSCQSERARPRNWTWDKSAVFAGFLPVVAAKLTVQIAEAPGTNKKPKTIERKWKLSSQWKKGGRKNIEKKRHYSFTPGHGCLRMNFEQRDLGLGVCSIVFDSLHPSRPPYTFLQEGAKKRRQKGKRRWIYCDIHPRA